MLPFLLDRSYHELLYRPRHELQGCDGRVRDRAELRYKLVWRRDGVVGMGLRKIWSVLRQRVYQHFAPRLITGCTLS